MTRVPTEARAALPASPPRPALLAGVLAVTLLAAFGCGGAPRQSNNDTTPKTRSAATGSVVGARAHSFALPDLEGKTFSSAALAGQVVILDFWATWCPPCREEMPDLVRLQSKYRDQGLQIVGLSLDAGGARDVAPFADEYNVNFTMLLANDELARSFDVTFVPTTLVLDRQGTIVKRFVGATSLEAFEAAILPLLASTS